MVSFVSLHPL